jgi:hypothetical protein
MITSMNTDNDWVRLPVEHHVARAEEHLCGLRGGDQGEDHLAHAMTRVTLTLREAS